MKRVKTSSRILVAAGLALLIGCSTNVRPTAPGEEPGAALEDARNEVRTMATDALQELYAREPGARQVVRNATGYAVFSNFGMKILVAGGGGGKGLAVSNRTRQEVFMRMAEIQAGLGFGIKKFRQVWVFQSQDAFDDFVNKGYEFGAQASLSAKTSSAGGAVAGAISVSPDVWVYQLTDEGLSAELTVKGTKYYRDKGLD